MTTPRFHVGERVEEVITDDHRPGTVAYCYSPPHEALVAVRLDGTSVPLAFHVDDVRRIGRRS